MIRSCAFGLIAGAAMGILASGARAQAPATLRIRADHHDRLLSVADIAALPHRQLRVAAENSSDSATVSGVALWDILQKAGVPSAEASGRQRAASYVRLVGADGQNAIFGLVELDPGFSKKTVLVADQRDGRSLDATEGPWRVFVPDETRHARWIRGLVAVEVGTLPQFNAAEPRSR